MRRAVRTTRKRRFVSMRDVLRRNISTAEQIKSNRRADDLLSMIARHCSGTVPQRRPSPAHPTHLSCSVPPRGPARLGVGIGWNGLAAVTHSGVITDECMTRSLRLPAPWAGHARNTRRDRQLNRDQLTKIRSESECLRGLG